MNSYCPFVSGGGASGGSTCVKPARGTQGGASFTAAESSPSSSLKSATALFPVQQIRIQRLMVTDMFCKH